MEVFLCGFAPGDVPEGFVQSENEPGFCRPDQVVPLQLLMAEPGDGIAFPGEKHFFGGNVVAVVFQGDLVLLVSGQDPSFPVEDGRDSVAFFDLPVHLFPIFRGDGDVQGPEGFVLD